MKTFNKWPEKSSRGHPSADNEAIDRTDRDRRPSTSADTAPEDGESRPGI